jgi:hypothetical protein
VPGQEGIISRSERFPFPRRETLSGKPDDLLGRSQAEKGSKVVWHSIECDQRAGRGRSARIASQPLCPGEARMSTLCTRQDVRLLLWRWLAGLLKRYLDPLVSHELHTGAPMLSATPVLPEQRSRPNFEGMEQPTRLFGGRPVPLTLLAQPTTSTVCSPGGVEHPQRAIGFPALFGRAQRLARRTAQGPLRLESKVLRRRSGQLSRAGSLRFLHSLSRAQCRLLPVRWQEQTRWCAAGKAQAHGPVPGARSRPIGR